MYIFILIYCAGQPVDLYDVHPDWVPIEKLGDTDRYYRAMNRKRCKLNMQENGIVDDNPEDGSILEDDIQDNTLEDNDVLEDNALPGPPLYPPL